VEQNKKGGGKMGGGASELAVSMELRFGSSLGGGSKKRKRMLEGKMRGTVTKRDLKGKLFGAGTLGTQEGM